MDAPTFLPLQRSPEYHKAVSTLQAKLALAGYALVPTTDDRGMSVFIVSRWGMTRQLDSLDDAEAFLARVKGQQA